MRLQVRVLVRHVLCQSGMVYVAKACVSVVWHVLCYLVLTEEALDMSVPARAGCKCAGPDPGISLVALCLGMVDGECVRVWWYVAVCGGCVVCFGGGVLCAGSPMRPHSAASQRVRASSPILKRAWTPSASTPAHGTQDAEDTGEGSVVGGNGDEGGLGRYRVGADDADAVMQHGLPGT